MAMQAMLYNNLLSIPVIILCSLFLEDWSPANIDRNFPPAIRSNLVLAIVFSGLSSVFISYTSAWCVRITSSTTYSMVGALNKLPIALSGLVFFSAPVTFPSVSVSCCVYDRVRVLTGVCGRRLLSALFRGLFMPWPRSSSRWPRAAFCPWRSP